MLRGIYKELEEKAICHIQYALWANLMTLIEKTITRIKKGFSCRCPLLLQVKGKNVRSCSLLQGSLSDRRNYFGKKKILGIWKEVLLCQYYTTSQPSEKLSLCVFKIKNIWFIDRPRWDEFIVKTIFIYKYPCYNRL